MFRDESAVRVNRGGPRQIVIVGNGAAALAAVESFRRIDGESRVTMVSGERCGAYSRVLLPYYLRGKVPYAHLFIRDEAFYKALDVELVTGAEVMSVDVCSSRVELGGGRSLPYDGLLLAPGSSPLRPPIEGLEAPEVHHLWHLHDALSLDRLFREGAHALVLGSGFVALQGAWAAVRRGLSTTVFELAERILPQVLDEEGAGALAERIRQFGVDLRTGVRTQAVTRDARGGLWVQAAGLDSLAVDLVIVGTGVRPNDHLLPHAVEPGTRGILVNERMETVVDGVFAAGDVVRGPVFDSRPPQIHALWPTAVEHGRVAGANMAGGDAAYRGSLSMNVTEMFGLTVASLGRFDAEEGDQVVLSQDPAGARYLKVVLRDGVPVGAVFLGAPDGVVALGRLRPYVRGRRPVADVEALLSGRSVLGRSARWCADPSGRWSTLTKERDLCGS